MDTKDVEGKERVVIKGGLEEEDVKEKSEGIGR
jgi:hypothetical protein